jgi:hypothetical protein
MANVIFQAYELPTFDSVSGTQLIAKTEGGQMGYVNASQLQTTLDGNGLATDTDISASNAARVSLSGSVSSSITSLSGSIATKMANTSFGYITGSFANDGAAASAGVAIGGLYHTTGTVKVRLS